MKNNKLKHFITNLDVNICVVFLAGMLVAATAQVIARYFFKQSLMWTDELCRFLLVWSSFLSVGCATRYDSHLFVDIIPGFLMRSKIFTTALMWVRAVIWVGFCIYFGKLGWDTFTRVVELSQALHISLKWIYLAIPVGMWLMAACVVVDTVKRTFFPQYVVEVDNSVLLEEHPADSQEGGN